MSETVKLEDWHKRQMQDWKYRFWYYVYFPYFWLLGLHLKWKCRHE